MFQSLSHEILKEIRSVTDKVDQKEVDCLIQSILQAKKITTCGAGRMGMMTRAFAMRLRHLDFDSYHIQDCNIPRFGKGDLVIAASGSGETKTILALVEVAKKHDATVALVTSRPQSSMGALADVVVYLPSLSKIQDEASPSSIQPMTTLTEQASLIFWDTLVLLLMQKMNQTHDMLKQRHSILE